MTVNKTEKSQDLPLEQGLTEGQGDGHYAVLYSIGLYYVALYTKLHHTTVVPGITYLKV